MLQYKTVFLPVSSRKISKSEWDKGFTPELYNSVVAPFGDLISEFAKGGWTLHSVVKMPINLRRKKTFFEMLLGWIPLLGGWLFPRLRECREGTTDNVTTLVFVKEVG